MPEHYSFPVNLSKAYVVEGGFVFLEKATEKEPDNNNSNSKLKLLIGILSPRDLPEFGTSVETSLQGYDKLWLKYISQSSQPYTILKNEFLKYFDEGRYSHIALVPDDLILNKEGVDKLWNNVLQNPKKYQVMQGICNTIVGSDQVATSKNLPTLERNTRRYDWYTKKGLQSKGEIIQVQHSGTAFAILDGRLIKNDTISLSHDKPWNPANEVGTSEDLVLSNDLARNSIPLWVDTTAEFLHLKQE